MSQQNFDQNGRQVTIAGNRQDAKRDVERTVEKIKEEKYAELARALEADEAPEEIRYLVRGAVLKCSCGSHKRKLNLPESHGVYIGENPIVNQTDCRVGDHANIPAFGVCESAGNPCRKSLGETLRDGLVSSLIPGSGAVITARDEMEKILLVKEDGTNVRGYPCTPCIVSNWQNAHGESQVASHGGSHYSRSGASHGGGSRRAGEPSHGGGSRRLTGGPALTEQSFLVCAYGGLIEPVTSGQENTDTEWIKDKGDEGQRTRDIRDAGASHGGGNSRHDAPAHG